MDSKQVSFLPKFPEAHQKLVDAGATILDFGEYARIAVAEKLSADLNKIKVDPSVTDDGVDHQ